MNRKLGRLPHNPLLLAAAPRIVHTGKGPPASLDRSHINYVPMLQGNNVFPDCTVAGLVNAALAAEAVATNSASPIDPDCWRPFYVTLSGCEDTDAAIAASDGLVELDVLRAMGSIGFDVGMQTPLTGNFGTTPCTVEHIASLQADLFCSYLGIVLYEADMDTPPDKTWDDDGTKNQGAVVGGHCPVGWDYLDLRPTGTGRMATWGYLQRYTMRWLVRRIQEAHGILLPGYTAANVNTLALANDNRQWLNSA